MLDTAVDFFYTQPLAMLRMRVVIVPLLTAEGPKLHQLLKATRLQQFSKDGRDHLRWQVLGEHHLRDQGSKFWVRQQRVDFSPRNGRNTFFGKLRIV
jgi:hypothetical protein